MSGSTIGGVLGGAIGFFAGGGWGGARVGFMIGSAVGGYVDPVRTQGPRLEDASAQTSSDGVPIPFGYGVFTCAGNVIWADKLIEHKHTERVGKGGGSQKQTTYTYTRSYAIGICEGQIHGLLWVKKNGKLVYSSNPAELGAMMHWTPQQIADLVASSNEFLKETTIYYGSDSQMPDSTIVAVEGMGNVSAHRGLAYIVIENEDLTNTGGAISQHEFCVQGTPPEAYLTSKVYPQIFDSSTTTSVSIQSGELLTVQRFAYIDSDTVTSVSIVGGEIEPPPINRFISDTATSVSIENGVLKVPPLVGISSDTVTAASIVSGDVRPTPLGVFYSDTTTNTSITGGTIS